MATKVIGRMGEKELAEFLGFHCRPKICETLSCRNVPVVGYVLCVTCLHGEPEKADPVYFRAKQRLAELRSEPTT